MCVAVGVLAIGYSLYSIYQINKDMAAIKSSFASIAVYAPNTHTFPEAVYGAIVEINKQLQAASTTPNK